MFEFVTSFVSGREMLEDFLVDKGRIVYVWQNHQGKWKQGRATCVERMRMGRSVLGMEIVGEDE